MSVVIGIGFGDEGKGHVTAWLASRTPGATVVRFNGGHQAGHNVNSRKLNMSHVFSNFGSGTLHGLPTYWSQFCTVDPVGVTKEHSMLAEKGVTPELILHPDCPVTTPYDKERTMSDRNYRLHGTVGVGFGATWQREEDHYSLTVGDLEYPSIVSEKLGSIAKYYGGNRLSGLDQRFLDKVDCMLKFVQVSDSLPKGTLIFEGAQGLMLDPTIGFFPHVTRSSVGTRNVGKLSPGTGNPVFMVTRAYATRHGAGPLPNEGRDDVFIRVSTDETNQDDGFQGRFRRAMLDTRTLNYAIKKGIKFHDKRLVVTCLDHMDEFVFADLTGKKVKCTSKYDFVQRVAYDLGIETRVLLSDSKYIEDITMYQL